MEAVFISSSHLVASVSVLQSGAWLWLLIIMLAGVLLSFLAYLRDRHSTFAMFNGRGSIAGSPALMLGPQFARIDYRGRVYETAPPRVIYMSEFLIVLNMRRSQKVGSPKSIPLVLWPDSLLRAEEARLRRYLRFELPENLDDS